MFTFVNLSVMCVCTFAQPRVVPHTCDNKLNSKGQISLFTEQPTKSIYDCQQSPRECPSENIQEDSQAQVGYK